MRPVLFFFDEPDLIIERVARQIGCTPDEARFQMECWDRMAIDTFCVGNDIPMHERN